jgi:hypothetical protein
VPDSDRSAAPASVSGQFEADARVVLFGYDDTPARVTLRHRSFGWRAGGAARTLGVSVVVAPIAALLPPHAIWPLGVLGTGAFLARRRWSEEFTLVELRASCPKCAQAFRAITGRLRMPHPLPCDGCHHEASLRVPDEVIERAKGVEA